MKLFGSGRARAALFLGPDKPLEIIEAAVPTPAAGELLVSVECCALCSSDLHTHAGRRTEPTPTVLGHEIVGRIMRFGPGAPRTDARGRTLEIGDRVTWTVAASCGVCVNCRDGFEQKCSKLVKYGHEKVTREMPFRGGLADVALLSPGTGIVKLPTDLPEDLPLEVLSLANCSTATVAAVLRTGFSRRNRPGTAVAVLGAGVLGLTACAMARQTYAASVVIAFDRDPGRAQRATEFGATHTCSDPTKLEAVVKEATANIGVDVAVELAGTLQATEAAIALARTGGTVVLAGTTLPTDPLVIEPQAIIRRLLRIEGVHNYVTSDLVTAVDFLSRDAKSFPMRSLIAASYPLAEINRALSHGHECVGRRIAILPANG